MGKLIKNHWARLIILTASTYQLAAAIHGYFWPKFFWDFLTKNLDGCVKPYPILQTINLVLAILVLVWEWPLPLIAGTWVQMNLELRVLLLPIPTMASALLYQGTNPALYYCIGMGVYFWAYCEGEVSSQKHVNGFWA